MSVGAQVGCLHPPLLDALKSDHLGCGGWRDRTTRAANARARTPRAALVRPPQARAGHRVRLGARHTRPGPKLASLTTPQPHSEPQGARFSAGPAQLPRSGGLAASANLYQIVFEENWCGFPEGRRI